MINIFRMTVVVILLTFMPIVFSKPTTIQVPIICDSSEIIFKNILSSGKSLVFIGQSEDTKISIFYNIVDKTWAVIQSVDNLSCVHFNGINGRYIYNV